MCVKKNTDKSEKNYKHTLVYVNGGTILTVF